MGLITGALRRTKKFVKRGWNIKSWVQVDQLKKDHEFTKSLLVEMVDRVKNPGKSAEDFNSLVEESKHTPSSIIALQKRARMFSYVYAAFGLLVVFYLIYLFCVGAILPAISCFSIVAVFAALSFKESFFAFCLDKKSFDQTFVSWLVRFNCRSEGV